MNDHDDTHSPTTQRRLWRRVWIGVALFVIVTPVLTWIAIDQGGKRAWRRVQEDLHAKGEPVSLAELNLPTRAEIPDEDNFGAVKWLRANDDGSESTEMVELEERLGIFLHRFEDEALRDFEWAWGAPFIGKASDLPLLTRTLDIAAEKEPEVTTQAKELEDYRDRLAAYLALHDHIWTELVAARERKHSASLPLLSERAKQVEYFPQVTFATLNPSMELAKVARWRTLLTAGRYQPDQFAGCLEVLSRLVEKAGNERTLIGTLVAATNSAIMANAFAEGLWNVPLVEEMRVDHFAALQIAWQRTDFHALAYHAQQIELVWMTATLMQFATKREGVGAYWGSPGPSTELLAILPEGWFANNCAFLADDYERHVFSPVRNGACLGELIQTAGDRNDQMRNLNLVQEFTYSLALMAAVSTERIFQRIAYTEARRRQAVIVCALHRYRLEHVDGFPDTLEALVPAYLDAIPVDPMDGKAMRYQRTNDGSDFLLWSIGFDATDDGGTLNLRPDHPDKTRLERDSYIGDWPWPTTPREFVRPESDSE